MTVDELFDWQVYDRLEPIGMRAFEDLHAASVRSAINKKASIDAQYPLRGTDLKIQQQRMNEQRAADPIYREREFKALLQQARALAEREKNRIQ